MERLFEMLSYKRPMDSTTEALFIERFLGPLGVEVDEAGNIFKRIGDSDVLWSSHTDTVHATEGMQVLNVTDNRVSLAEDSPSNCLGADCGTGVFIMTEMIKANKPGLYVFHRGEEHGAHGSRHIAKTKTLLEGINMAIAFDRYGQNSIITYQGGRCASEKFASSIHDQIKYLSADSGGVFTDTANYTDLVPECTNLSVGYMHHHQRTEYQDLKYLQTFLDSIIALDTTKLVIDRDPSVSDWGDWYGGYSTNFPANRVAAARPDGGYGMHPWDVDEDEDEKRHSDDDLFLALIRQNPIDAMAMMKLYGVTKDEFLEYCFATSGY